MKNYISINQGNFIKISKDKNIKVDAVDGILFDWIKTFTLSEKAIKKVIDNKLFIWVSYKAIREDNPLCNIKTNDAIGRRLNKLVDLGLIEKYLSKEDGNKTFYHITSFAYAYLLENRELPTQKSEALPTQKSYNSKLVDSELNSKSNKKPNNIKWADEFFKSDIRLNLTAVYEWLEFKRYSYKVKSGITKLCNFLVEYDLDTQQKIVDNSIMNNYQGLFPPKGKDNQSNNQGARTINGYLY